MSSPSADFARESSQPQQCMYSSEQDGTRCRAIAMQGEMVCFDHRPGAVPPVLENDPFLIDHLDTRDAIQRALGQLGARLSSHHMDFPRAKLLLQTLTLAMRNLPPIPKAGQPAPAPRATASTGPPAENESPATAEQASAAAEPDPSPAAQTPAAQTPAAQTPAAQTPAARDLPALERPYTAEEDRYFRTTITALGYEPGSHARPASITEGDILFRTQQCRAQFGLPRLPLKRDKQGRLLLNERPEFSVYR